MIEQSPRAGRAARARRRLRAQARAAARRAGRRRPSSDACAICFARSGGIRRTPAAVTRRGRRRHRRDGRRRTTRGRRRRAPSSSRCAVSARRRRDVRARRGRRAAPSPSSPKPPRPPDVDACRGSRCPTRGSRSRRSPPRSTAIRARSSRSSASPAPTARRRRRTCSRRSSRRPACACGRIGTVGYRIGDRELEAARTTPEAPELQRMLREMVTQGCGACVMEVSSHALALHRADHLRFAAAIFTNLTRDHLDFHGDMEQYFAAKRRLFELLPAGASASSTSTIRRGAEFAAAARRPVTYAIDAPADVRPGPLAFSLDGLAFDVRTPRGTLQCARRSSAGRTSTTSSPRSPPRWRSTCRSARSKRASRRSTACPAASRSSPTRRRRPRRRRLRAHRRRAEEPARDGAAAGGRPADHGVRLRRRSRSHEAAADGRGRRAAERSRGRHLRQPALGGSGADHRGDQARHRACRPIARRRTGQRAPKSTPYLAIADRKAAIERAVRDARPGDLVLDRRQGAREVPGDRRPHAAVRRRRGGARRRWRGGAPARGCRSDVERAAADRRATSRPPPADGSCAASPRQPIGADLDRLADARAGRLLRRDPRRAVRRPRVRRRRARARRARACWSRRAAAAATRARRRPGR